MINFECIHSNKYAKLYLRLKDLNSNKKNKYLIKRSNQTILNIVRFFIKSIEWNDNLITKRLNLSIYIKPYKNLFKGIIILSNIK